jgi:hypothetical protein
MTDTNHMPLRTIFVIVHGGVAEVDFSTVPEGVTVEVIDLDDLAADTRAGKKLSRAARAYTRQQGYL